jgi:hypothetical protein
LRLRHFVASGTVALALTLAAGFVTAQTPVDEEAPWPRVRTTNGHTVTLHLPQVESWTSNSFQARAAVGLKMAGAKSEWLGVIWLAAHGSVDRSNRIVMLDGLEITKARFPEAPDGGSNALAVLRDVVPSGARTVSLDYLITALGFAQACARQGPRGLKNTPPEIVWATNRTVLVLMDGEPVLRPVPNGSLQRIVNTPALIVFDKAGGRFYLNGDGLWFMAGSIQGPWSLAQTPPAEVAALAPAPTDGASTRGDEPVPRILVRTRPAELLMTSGLPDFRPIRGTALQYAADTDSQLFFHNTDREAYVLLSGRWFKAKALGGPWTYVAPRDLPADFAKIPPGSPQAVVLASVPDTRQAELAVLANSVPTTATVSRRDATMQLTYDGEPKFKTIEGTRMSYALNAQLPVILASGTYYALDNGVWFTAPSATGPWTVATEVPEEIYTIPPNSPVYYATFARVYQSTDDEVEVGYTPGYQGTYEEDGTVVYGTGWDYEYWYSDDYYGWGWTWGYNYWYVPWYQWWVWRNWWDRPGALRSALVENIYDRWQGRNGVTHHDRPAGTAAARPAAAGFSGYPALYGRFRGATRPTALSPPPNTIALNPYSRPQSAARPGEVPHGAQLLSAVRQSPGGGRDLYASPDGGVYLRKNDGWYRRESGGQWKFAAPTQGTMERSQLAATRGTPRQSSAGDVYRPAAGAGLQGRPGRVPDSGFEARASEIAALEREYYARSLAQYRAQNWGGGNNRARSARGGFRRR